MSSTSNSNSTSTSLNVYRVSANLDSIVRTVSDPYTTHSNNRWTPTIEIYALAIKQGKYNTVRARI